jgi:hypothetical protein
MHTHHAEDHAAAEVAGAASWMVAMFALIVAAALVIGLLLWAPWHSSSVTTNSGPFSTQSGQQGGQAATQNPNQPNVNIPGTDINVGGAGQSPGH